MKKNKLFIILAVIFVIAVSNGYAVEKSDENLKKDTVCIIGVGDIMPGTNYPEDDYLPPDAGKQLMAPVKAILQDADLTFGNLEGTLLNSGECAKSCSDPSKCYAFRIPESYVSLLTDAGFDVVSLANNHVGDFGNAGRKKTVETLENVGIHFAGLLTCPSAIFDINGITYGFCAFAPNVGTTDIRNIAKARKLVRKLDKQADIVMVSFHGGAEGASHRHVTRKTEEFYGENRGNVYEFAHAVIDAGADVVFGHGPHITRAVELYKDRFIAYSLGNFCTYARFNLKSHNGVAPIIQLFVNREGAFSHALIYPIQQIKPGGPKLDPAGKVIREIQELTVADFPETPLIIQADGKILKR